MKNQTLWQRFLTFFDRIMEQEEDMMRRMEDQEEIE